MKQRESVKLKERAKKEPKDQHQSRHSMRLRALFATDRLEQKVA